MTSQADRRHQQEEGVLEDIALPDVSGVSGRLWQLRKADLREALSIAQSSSLDSILSRVLAARGQTAETAPSYLNPSLRDELPDPLTLMGMEKASAHIADAILAETSIGVFGDYDVDGTSAAAILKTYFSSIGRPLEVYLPDRMLEGYGPTIKAFMSLKEQGVQTIITVDCGATAFDPVDQAAANGLDVIILDHHLMDGPPPVGATATVNPNQPGDRSGLTGLSAAGVAFMAVVAVNRRLREARFFENRQEPNLMRLLDLTALGLVCDVMPMTGTTRLLVAQGLKVLSGGGNPGLLALGACAGMKGKASTYHLGFLLGPRINAAGRIGHARLAFDLLTTNDAAKRNSLAEKLHIMNAERQEIEADVQQEAVRVISSQGLDADEIIVVAGEGWHHGVIGIVAGRLKEQFDKPVIVIGLDGENGKASGRSITGVDLGGAVKTACSEGLIITGGGHEMAAGLSLSREQVKPFRQWLNERLGEDVQTARQNRRLQIDSVIAPNAVSKTFAETVEQAGPFGPGNPEPVFALTDLNVRNARTVGKNHISLTLVSGTGETVRAIAFRADGEPLGEILRTDSRVHVAGKVRADDWRGGNAGQLQITDAALAE